MPLHAIIIVALMIGLLIFGLQDIFPVHIRKKNKFKEPKNH